MPRWTLGDLVQPPRFRWRDLPLLVGPGLVMGVAAVGGGEWLTGPFVTARYGGALLWLAALSILFQVIYNIEICRYTLYCGEPIFSGKFRTLPGPMFWVVVYLLLDFGSFLPYLISNSAIPLASLLLGRLPDLETEAGFVKLVASVLWAVMFVPLIFGGRVYNSLKVITVGKLIFLIVFLGFLALGYSTRETWREILSGFFRFGTLPFLSPTPGEPSELRNVFAMLFAGETFPALDLSLVGMITAMAAIAGNGGLTNTPISNLARDQGWGMGAEVGAIPSIIGGKSIVLSHVGRVFSITENSLRRWRGWLRHVQRDQILVWLPACFFGMALPSMLSVQFLPKGVVPPNKFYAAAMTADGVATAVGEEWGRTFWQLTLFCGFLVLITSAIITADGILRRWVDIFWTASPTVRTWDPRMIGRVYFTALCIYAVGGLIALNTTNGDKLLVWSTNIYNYALGFSCWHVLVINLWLLPRDLRPGWPARLGLVLGGVFFMTIALLTTADSLKLLTPPAAA